MLAVAFVMVIWTTSQSVEGDWITPDRAAVVAIAPCSTGICGTVTRILARGANVPTKDVNNPDSRLRSRPLVGLQVLSGFKKEGPFWKGGLAYDPKSGKSYKTTLALNSDGTMTVTGCVFVICRSQRWTRAVRNGTGTVGQGSS